VTADGRRHAQGRQKGAKRPRFSRERGRQGKQRRPRTTERHSTARGTGRLERRRSPAPEPAAEVWAQGPEASAATSSHQATKTAFRRLHRVIAGSSWRTDPRQRRSRAGPVTIPAYCSTRGIGDSACKSCLPERLPGGSRSADHHDPRSSQAGSHARSLPISKRLSARSP
jgi:hypothetical protein